MHHFLRVSILLLFQFSLLAYAQISLEPLPGTGARVVGLGNAYTAVRGDVWSLFHNPATLTGVQSLQIGTFLEQRFLLNELSFASVGVAYPFAGNQAAGLSVSSKGFSDFRQNHASLSYGITLLDKISLGSRLNVANVAITNYGSVATFYADIGVHYQFNSQLALGATMTNVNQASVANTFGEAQQLPTILAVGISYQPVSQVLVVADVVKQVRYPASFRGGIEYMFSELLAARLGVGTEPLMLGAGIGVDWQGLEVDFTLSYTEYLQYTPHFSLSYQLGTQREP